MGRTKLQSRIDTCKNPFIEPEKGGCCFVEPESELLYLQNAGKCQNRTEIRYNERSHYMPGYIEINTLIRE